jgi:hypothetical protein
VAYTIYRLDTRQPASNSERPIINPDESVYGVVETATRFGIWNPETLDYDPYPKKQKPLTQYEFMERFTDAELVGIYTAAKQYVHLEIQLKKMEAATEIYLDNPTTVAGVNSLASAGLITTERAAEILRDE